jgi:hypothetical protein
MKLKNTATGYILLACAFAFFQSWAFATPVIQGTSGLSSPDVAIDFSEGNLPAGSVTNQFTSLGATFSPELSLFLNISGRPNFEGPALLNFTGGPVVIDFSFDLSDATFAFTTNSGTTTFESLLDGVVVENFTSGSASPVNLAPNNFFGFTDSRFNQIRLTGPVFALDNLSFNAAEEVPSPAPLALFLSALALLVVRRFK